MMLLFYYCHCIFQVFTNDDHYNLRARARPVDYSLTRRSFDFEFEEDFPSQFSSRVDSSPTKQQQIVGNSGIAQDSDKRTSSQSEHFKSNSEQLEATSPTAGHSWPEDPRISSSRIKNDPDRFPIKAAESLHPAFHKHLFSQVHQHQHHSKSSSESLDHGRIPSSSAHSRTGGMESYRDHRGQPPRDDADDDDDDDRKVKEETQQYESHRANSPSFVGTGIDTSVRDRERSISEGSQSLLSSGRERLPLQSSFEEGEIDTNTHVVEYPSQFPGLKDRISIKNETVLVTKLNGVNIKTGGKVSLYKCYMCNKMYNKMSQLQCHMSVHFERSFSMYTCDLCGATFRFRLQLTRHASRVHHSKPYTPPVRGRHRWLSQSSAAPTEGSTVTSPEDYKTRSPLVTNRESPTEGGPPAVGSTEQHGREPDKPPEVPHDHSSSHLARSSDQSSPTLKDSAGGGGEGEQERSLHQPDEQELAEQGVRYHGYPIGSIGSSLASSHPSLHKYLYRRYSGTYVCQYCNKTFFRLFSLQRHEQVHTGVKACFCKECGKGFSEPRNLRQHIIRYHGEHGSIGDEDFQSIRRLRRPISSGLPRTSQRLAPVTPDMIEEAERLEKQAAIEKMGVHQPPGGRSVTASPPSATFDYPKLPASYPAQHVLGRSRTYSGGSETRDPASALVGDPRLTSPSSSATSQLKVDTTSPITSHPSSSAFGPASAPLHAPAPPPQPSPSGHLASEIRQKEKLSEDVVVIIPSDAPLESAEPSAVTPHSAVSDTPSWPEPGGSDTDSTQSMEVIHAAPVRPMMMDYRNIQMRVRERRKGHQPVRIPSPSDEKEIAHLPPQEQFSPRHEDRASVIREKLPSPAAVPPPGLRGAPLRERDSPSPATSTSPAPMSSPTMASMASAGMLFPGAHDISNTTSPLAGLPPGAPPLYLGSMLHPGLLSPSTLPLLRGAAPGLLHPGAPPGLDPATALRLGLPSPTAWAAMAESFSPSGSSGGATGAGGDPRMPTPYARSSSSAGRNSR